MSYLTVHEVADLFRVSDLTVRRWIWSGKLPATRVGRVLRVRRSDLESFAKPSAGARGANAESARPGSPTAWLVVAEHWSQMLNPEDIEELERLIAEGCERPGEIGDPLA